MLQRDVAACSEIPYLKRDVAACTSEMLQRVVGYPIRGCGLIKNYGHVCDMVQFWNRVSSPRWNSIIVIEEIGCWSTYQMPLSDAIRALSDAIRALIRCDKGPYQMR